MRILIHNLPATVQNCDLFKLFRPHGAVKDISIPTGILGNGLGHAYVIMQDRKAAQHALKHLQNEKLHGSMLVIEELYAPLD